MRLYRLCGSHSEQGGFDSVAGPSAFALIRVTIVYSKPKSFTYSIYIEGNSHIHPGSPEVQNTFRRRARIGHSHPLNPELLKEQFAPNRSKHPLFWDIFLCLFLVWCLSQTSTNNSSARTHASSAFLEGF